MTCEVEVSGPSYAPDAGGQCGKKAVAVCVDCLTDLCAEHVVMYNGLPDPRHPYRVHAS